MDLRTGAAVDSASPYEGIRVEGKAITVGVLWGIFREDPVLGFTHREGIKSVNGWWESNNIGARSRQPTTRHKEAHTTRVLVFGESFAQGSRLRQEESWTFLLQKRHPSFEMVNLAVDGYSMAQAYLRFEKLRDRLDYDLALFVWLPPYDLWRDINTIRSLAEPWNSFTVLPRCLDESGPLRCVSGPYARGSDTYRRDGEHLSLPLIDHLRRYDRFYSPWTYEDPALLSHSLTFRLLSAFLVSQSNARLLRESYGLTDLHTEAVRTARRIFQAALQSARKQGARLAVLLLADPNLIAAAVNDPLLSAHWESLAKSLSALGVPVIDLLPEERAIDSKDLDTGYDGSHFGPRFSGVVAELVHRRLEGPAHPGRLWRRDRISTMEYQEVNEGNYAKGGRKGVY